MRIDSRATDAYLRLARLHVAAGQLEPALLALEFQPGGRPEEVEAALLHVQVLSRMGRLHSAPKSLTLTLAAAGRLGSTVVAMGEGVRERDGEEAALKMMRAFEPLDLDDPGFADALGAIIEDLAALGRADEGLALTEASLKAAPDATVFRALRARALHLAGRPTEAVRAAYRAVLEEEPENERALRGLARLEAEQGDAKAAWAIYERSLDLDPHDPATALAGAETLVTLDRSSDAEAVLAELLRERPYDAPAARRLAELRVERGAIDQRTRDLARRAVSFGGGEAARTLFERLKAEAAPAAEAG
jgi:predicted Zn-dependent protease